MSISRHDGGGGGTRGRHPFWFPLLFYFILFLFIIIIIIIYYFFHESSSNSTTPIRKNTHPSREPHIKIKQESIAFFIRISNKKEKNGAVLIVWLTYLERPLKISPRNSNTMDDKVNPRPWEVVELLAPYLDAKTPAAASCVSKSWYASMSAEHLWESLCTTHYPSIVALRATDPSVSYRRLHAIARVAGEILSDPPLRQGSHLHHRLAHQEFLSPCRYGIETVQRIAPQLCPTRSVQIRH